MDLAIVNRGFWPEGQLIGEALLALAEKSAESKRVCVITQSDENIRKALNNSKRGGKIHLKECHSRSNANSNISVRLLDGFIFMLWTIYSLITTRPKKVYISTNPPIFLPFVIFLYCAIFRAKYYYHLQDIHPEAANIVLPLNKKVYLFLSWIDSIVMRHATGIMTLSEEMKEHILTRSKTTTPILLIDNPALIEKNTAIINKTKDVIFCGTAGRFQKIPLLLESIKKYLHNGGMLNFTFVGRGVYQAEIQLMSEEFNSVSYLGFLSAKEAEYIVSQHHWALLPIDDEVTNYAFPSKSSSYVVSNCHILAICSENTSVSNWVKNNKLGIVSNPDVKSIISHFKSIEQWDKTNKRHNHKLDFSISYFVEKTLDFIEI